ncbi:hypothetical protein D3C80_436350 [compost metagenome]
MKQARLIERCAANIVDQHRIFCSTRHHLIADGFGIGQQRTCCRAPDFRQVRLASTRRPGKDYHGSNPVWPAIDKIHRCTVRPRDHDVFAVIAGLMLKSERNLTRCVTHRCLQNVWLPKISPGYVSVSFLFACILASLDQRPGIGMRALIDRVVHRRMEIAIQGKTHKHPDRCRSWHCH